MEEAFVTYVWVTSCGALSGEPRAGPSKNANFDFRDEPRLRPAFSFHLQPLLDLIFPENYSPYKRLADLVVLCLTVLDL